MAGRPPKKDSEKRQRVDAWTTTPAVKAYVDKQPSRSAYLTALVERDMLQEQYTNEAMELLWDLTQESLQGKPDQQWGSREEWAEDCETLTDIPNLMGPNGMRGVEAANAAASGDVPALVWLRVDAFGLPAFS